MLYLDDPVSGARAEFFPSTTSWKDYVMAPGGIAAIVPTDPASLRFVHKDSLGSTEALTDSTGTRVEQDSYGPWGLRRNVDGTDDTQGTLTSQTDKGFTGHQHLPEVTLISMGARIYDPALGRFASPDPTIPAPANGQAYNRYAYVLNNPLAYTDPNGYGFFSSLSKPFVHTFNAVGHAVDHALSNDLIRSAVAIAAAYFIGPTAYGNIFSISNAYVASAAAGFTGGVIAGRSIEAGLLGAATATAFYGVGEWAGHTPDFGTTDYLKSVVGHAAVGCASAAAAGGSCGAGAFGAAAGAAVAPGLRDLNSDIAAVTITATIGGTASELGGGKFANGAFTAGFGYLFNSLGDRLYGIRAHQVLQEYLSEAAPGDWQVEYRVLQGRIDLLYDEEQIYEIKPEGSSAAAVEAQLARYINAALSEGQVLSPGDLSNIFPDGMKELSITPRDSGFLGISTTFIYEPGPKPGIVFYNKGTNFEELRQTIESLYRSRNTQGGTLPPFSTLQGTMVPP